MDKQSNLEKKLLKNKKFEGAKIYFVNRERNLLLFRLKKDLLKKGFRMIVSHIDSPRLDFKPNPLYEKESLAFLKTHYYGGIKKYHWPTIPLALYGTIYLKNGDKIDLSIGEKEDEPIFMISDLLPHLASKQMGKPLREAIEGEELNLIIGSLPIKNEKVKEKVKLAILKILNDKYGIIEEDFFSAELQAVPVGKARDLGFDRALITSYGQDDRVCAFTSLEAILQDKKSKNSELCFLTEKEEIGSDGVSGAKSTFLENVLLKILSLYKEKPGLSDVYEVFSLSKALSADVTSGFDPDYQQVYDPLNTARLGFGVAIEKHTGSGGKYSTSEASAEFTFQIRDIFNQNNVDWQSAGLGKIDEGGGGTIAKFLANRNIDTIDCGVPLFNMHAPYEISSKADVYSAFEAYFSFFKK